MEALIPLIHPDFETTTPAALAAEPDTYRGPEGVRRYFDSFYEAMEEVRFVPEGFEDLGGGRVLVPITLTARGRSTGIEAQQNVAQVWEVRDNLAYRVFVFADAEEARASLGD